jgi:hypothetical protein
MMRRFITATALFLALAGGAFCSGAWDADTFSASGVHTIQVKAGALDVEARANDVFGVSVGSDLQQASLFDSRSSRLMHRQSGSTLTVWVQSSAFFGRTERGSIRLEVPRGIDLRIESSSGAITVDGIEGGSLNARTVSGRVSVRDMRGDLAVNTVAGEIQLDSVEGRIQAQTVSGSIEGNGVLPAASASFISVSGKVNVKMDTALEDVRFDLSTVTGEIVVGKLMAQRGLRMGFGGITVKGHTVSGSLNFQ